MNKQHNIVILQIQILCFRSRKCFWRLSKRYFFYKTQLLYLQHLFLPWLVLLCGKHSLSVSNAFFSSFIETVSLTKTLNLRYIKGKSFKEILERLFKLLEQFSLTELQIIFMPVMYNPPFGIHERLLPSIQLFKILLDITAQMQCKEIIQYYVNALILINTTRYKWSSL